MVLVFFLILSNNFSYSNRLFPLVSRVSGSDRYWGKGLQISKLAKLSINVFLLTEITVLRNCVPNIDHWKLCYKECMNAEGGKLTVITNKPRIAEERKLTLIYNDVRTPPPFPAGKFKFLKLT